MSRVRLGEGDRTPLAVRRLGRSDVHVTTVGLGGANLGNLHRAIDDATATSIVDAAWDRGVRYFDTAPHYGLGLSERRLGAALRGRERDELVVSTKVGRVLDLHDVARPDDEGFDVVSPLRRRFDFTSDGVRRSLDDSLERLGLDRIDIALIHDPDHHADQAITEAYPALAALRDQGVVGAIGVGMNQTVALERFVRETDIDVVMCAGRYTLLDRSALDGLLPACEQRGVSVLAAGVFNSGILANPTSPSSATYDYAPASQEVRDRVAELFSVVASVGESVPHVALHFPLQHPAVAAIVVGAGSAEEVAQNLDHVATPVAPEVWDALGLPPRGP
jgi:D-threo-aldose 1-dehydrogenase